MLSVKKIATDIKGVVKGNSNFIVKGICDIENGKKEYLTYLKNLSYSKYLLTTKASVIITEKLENKLMEDKVFIIVENAGLAFSIILGYIKQGKYNFSNKKNEELIPPSAKISPNVSIGKNVVIGKKTVIMSGSHIGNNVRIGNESIIFPNVVLYDNVEIGNHCKIDSGTVIGADGFGLIKDKKKNRSIPHIGKVIIGNDVFIGANCCIDRGTINNTVIKDNSRLDNFVQIAHNVKVGKSCIIAGQVGIAGSTILEDNVTVAGQTGIIDHLKIGENSIITAKSLVCNDLKPDSFVSGNPAFNHKDRLKLIASLRNFPKFKKIYD